MSNDISNQALLELINRPAFCVKDGQILQANQMARQRTVQPGTPVADYLVRNPQAYENFSGGCLFLTLWIEGIPYPASVTSMEGYDLFLLDWENDISRQAMALASQQLRQSLSGLYAVLDTMKNGTDTAYMRQSLYQMHRTLCNMSDVARYDICGSAQTEPTNLTAFFAETVEKAQTMLEKAGYHLHYTALPEVVMGMADREILERSVLNLISNAVKFSPKGSVLKATLVRSGKMLRFTLQDPGDGIAPEVMQQVFSRYQREPAIEDGRHGMGLGLSLVCMAAARHEGTVLMDQPPEGGTRVTMTVKVIPCPDQMVRSPMLVFRYDYAGGHDHGLLELSDVLPADMYK